MGIRSADYTDISQWEYRLRSHSVPHASEIHSGKYLGDKYEYKHVIMTREQYKMYRDEVHRLKGGFVSEEFILQTLNIRQTNGWEHYYIYPPNPNVLCLRRILVTK
ncbi:hypothetical protein BEWA_015570 [Theileria equi strain WA]|uniref:Cyclin-dependent kinases regulatory subunit n=1 Tax=Theileria equi strain WA TaxID=1537102 RepID=L1LCC5_THEEQ|nr:hypothetical protein BEWA_015570 [Theileria equi strain WA]EKX72996.1 hypothetical protein BEWA_015570 [Theileria equi strain WA]|eukprot:XP_004832448.1 hypothetical protein BEWA_015570 [Theileria equi strain WA]